LEREDLGYLTETEVVRQTPFKVHLSIQNLGELAFPGGKIIQRAIESASLFAQVKSFVEEPLEVPPIGPGMKIDLDPWPMMVEFEGPVWITVKMEAKDGQSIEMYQVPGGSPTGTNEWRNLIYVVNRERLYTMMLLRDILKKLGEGGKGNV
jgi:hypothetical protein